MKENQTEIHEANHGAKPQNSLQPPSETLANSKTIPNITIPPDALAAKAARMAAEVRGFFWVKEFGFFPYFRG